MADFLDRLSYPQYEQGGRFNLLSLFQLPYALSGAANEDIDRRKGIRKTTEELAQSEASAGLERSRSRRGYALEHPEANVSDFEINKRQLSGMDTANAMAELHRRISDLEFQRREESRGVLTKAYGETPETITGRESLQGIIRQGQLGQAQADEELALGRAGGAISAPGMELQRLTAGQGEAEAGRRSHEQLSREAIASKIISDFIQVNPGDQVGLQGLAEAMKRAGYPVFSGKPHDPRTIAAEIDQRGGRSAGGQQPAPALPTPSAAAPTTPPPSEARQMIDRYIRQGALGPGAGNTRQQGRGPRASYAPSAGGELDALRQLEQYLGGVQGTRGNQGQMYRQDLDTVRRIIQALRPDMSEEQKRAVLGAMNLDLRQESDGPPPPPGYIRIAPGVLREVR